MPQRYSTPGPLRSAVGVAVPLRCSAAPLQPEISVLAHSGVHADSPLREATVRDQTSDTACQSSACTIFRKEFPVLEMTLLFRHITGVCMQLVDKLLFHLSSTKLLLSALFVARRHLFPPALLDSTSL